MKIQLFTNAYQQKKLHNLPGSILSTFWIFRPSSHQPCQAFSQKEVLFDLFFKSWIIFQFKILVFESNIPTKESLTGLHFRLIEFLFAANQNLLVIIFTLIFAQYYLEIAPL